MFKKLIILSAFFGITFFAFAQKKGGSENRENGIMTATLGL